MLGRGYINKNRSVFFDSKSFSARQIKKNKKNKLREPLNIKLKIIFIFNF